MCSTTRKRNSGKNEALLIERLHQTSRCRSEVEQTAIFFSELSVTQYEELIRILIETGDDKACGILLCVGAVNKIKLDPGLLAESLKVVEPIIDFAFPFCMQDQTAIEPLLAMALAQDISQERQAFAVRLAAELAVRYDKDSKPVKKVLLKLSHEYLPFETRMLNTETLALLELKDIPDDIPWLTQENVLEALPKEKPPVVIGGTYSVRRPVPKLGRNAPCHCGSGKKYKKCCLEKDQALIRDASPYEGLTMTELRSRPGLVDDPGMIEEMRAYELKKLDPEKLGNRQLLAAYRRSVPFGLRELAFHMLLELEGRSDFDFDAGHFEDLLDSVLDANDIELARKIKAHIPEDMLSDPEETAFHFDLLENQTGVAGLEKRCRKALTDENEKWDDPLLTTACNLENLFPALSIIFSRAAIVGNPDLMLDNETSLGVIHKGRTELDLDPWEDPIEGYFDWLLMKEELDIEEDAKSREIQELKDKVVKAKHLASQRLNELRKKELELDGLSKKLEREEEEKPNVSQVTEGNAETERRGTKTIAELRARIENLKLDISSGQQERRHLRKKIQDEQEKALVRQKTADEKKDYSEPEKALDYENVPKRILIPEFTEAFRRSCNSMSGTIVAKSLKAVSGFATHDRLTWRQTKSLEGIPGVFSIRIGIHHRLMIRWEREMRLEVLDLIQREKLDTWIKQKEKS